MGIGELISYRCKVKGWVRVRVYPFVIYDQSIIATNDLFKSLKRINEGNNKLIM